MKRVVFWVLLGGMFLIPGVSFGRLFFVGSNPYLSVTAFPQDLLLQQGDYFSYSVGFQSLPWWGDIDEPANRPNESYSSTGENITFVKDETDTEEAYFSHYGAMGVVVNRLDYLRVWSKKFRMLYSFNYEMDSMYSQAKGNLKAVSTNGVISYIPVDFSSSHWINNFSFETVMGIQSGTTPWGIKLGVSMQDTADLSHYLKFTVDGTNYSSERLLWGWATSGCNHIFGYKQISADAWLQNSYSIGPLWKIDGQVGLTLPKVKLGSRIRFIQGVQGQYSWEENSTNTVLESNFDGEYVQSPWSKKTEETLYRLYGNVLLQEGRYHKLNLLLFLGLDFYNAYNALAENLEVQRDWRESFKNIVVEANPNLNIRLGKFYYIDLALLLEYSYTFLENTYDRWNSLLGGSKTTYWDTSVYVGPEYWWENFSYGIENFFDAGVDISLLVPVIEDKGRSLALNIILFANSKFTTMVKHYGSNSDTETDVVFSIANYRDNYKREIWFNSLIGLTYRGERFTLRLDVTEPLIYSLFKTTSVYDSNHSTVQYNNEKTLNWAVQQGSRVMFQIIYNI